MKGLSPHRSERRCRSARGETSIYTKTVSHALDEKQKTKNKYRPSLCLLRFALLELIHLHVDGVRFRAFGLFNYTKNNILIISAK
jgi:hypothetical protein